ncbi:MAG: hypothetical protein ING02_19305, partial [Roseomonas sp.]|nr:hypothetical protein [Roseomonas sp.]
VSIDLLSGTGRDAFGGIDNLSSIEIINGSSFADTIAGGTANETLYGGSGNDLYFVNGIADLVIELSGGGADTVIASASMTIPNQVEVLQVAAGVAGISITGSAGNDVLITNGLANNVNGGGGDDVILTGTTTLADIYALFGP